MEDKNLKEGYILFRGNTYSKSAIRKAAHQVRKCLIGKKGTVGIITENPAFMLAAMIGIQQAACHSFELNACDGSRYNQCIISKFNLVAVITDGACDINDAIIMDETVWAKTQEELQQIEPEFCLVRERTVKNAEPVLLTEKEGRNCIQFMKDILKRNLQHTIYIHEKSEQWNPFVLQCIMEENCCIEVIEAKREEWDAFHSLKVKEYTCLYMSLTQFHAWKYAIITEKNIKTVLHDVITYGNELYDICSIKDYFKHQGIMWYHFIGNGQYVAVSAVQKEENGNLYHLAKEIRGCQVRIMNRAKKEMPIGVPGFMFVCHDNVIQTEFLGKRLKDGKIKLSGWNADCCYCKGRFVSLSYVEQQIKDSFSVTKIKMQLVKDKIVLFYASKKRIEKKEQQAFEEAYIPTYYPDIEWNHTTEDIIRQTTFQNLLKRRKEKKENYNETQILSQQQKEIVKIWREVLKQDELGMDDNFFYVGGNSALFVQMLAAVSEKTKRELPMLKLMEHSTLRSFLTFLERDDVIEEVDIVENIKQDIIVEPYLKNKKDAMKEASICKNILLTGSNGFLGCFLLKELLERTDATIYCLLRAKSEQEAYQKLFDAMCSYKLEGYLDYSRIRPVLGDLGKDKLGMNEAQYAVMCEEIDMIIHNGAVVNFIFTYEMLKNENVMGTGRILELASTRKIKPVHYISSIAIFGIAAKQTAVDETFVLCPEELPRSGYNKTKWVADALVTNAREAGLPCNIYRVGNICGDLANGICQTRDFLWMLFKIGIEMHVFPEYYQLPFAMTPVDNVAESIVRIALAPQTGENYHIMTDHRVIYQQLLGWMKSYGIEYELIEFQKWVDMVRQYTRKLGDHKYQSIPAVIGVKEDVADDFQFITYNNTKTLEKVRQLGGEILPLTEKTFHKHLTHFIESGFIRQDE